MFSEKERHSLLRLARDAIMSHPNHDGIVPSHETQQMREKRGVFVTLTIEGALRGCIGYIEPIATVTESVIECAVSAAYRDPRFRPLSKSESGKIHIEISILTLPRRLAYKDSHDLLDKLNHKLGVIIKKGMRSSTFLPQVWEDLPDKEEFLSHLCMKAGLEADEWKNGALEVKIYEVESFEED